MKYDEKKFDNSVEEYKKILGNVKEKSFLIVFDIKNKKAFFSIAPLSRALHELNADVNVIGIDKKSEALEAIKEVWKSFKNKDEVLMDFINAIEKKSKEKFSDLFEKPDYILEANDTGFNGNFSLKYNDSWFKEHKSKELIETCKKIWGEVYELKDGEKVSIGFALIQKQEMLGHPLEDYLDSYAIIWGMKENCNGSVRMGSSTQRISMLDKSEKISELKATLLGCELSKEADEEIFIKYKKLSCLLNLKRLKPIDASFFISGKGYPGKHLFGEVIGYPSLNKKTRWQSPGQMIYQLDFFPQTALDDREPTARVGFTETLPIGIFIETCNIDWKAMRERNYKIKDIEDKCDIVKVSGEEINGVKTDLEIGLVKKDGGNRWVRTSDTDVREKINSEYLERTGIKAGTMANLPGGEAFVTPEYVKGTFVGDVVISIDQSYLLSEKNPLVIETYGDGYKVISGQKEIIEKFEEKKKDAWEMIMNMEKNKSAPKELIELKKANFNRVGEFAINTNPNAKLCNYLIVNEKIARMIHIALGSGFEPDRSTEYHTDIVINSPRQKLDIYGIDKEGNKLWIIKKGEFVV
ncbi:hypothetical protein CMO93_02910 [Candidatus Woesearchaeota archaeon]|nr:hypothetical protein [Candidatus Woesearchaeota archaeon]|tara:strand:- start:1005 stop:2747 length:1743 start_codon:yes stop_codon:yes gene_type:complete